MSSRAEQNPQNTGTRESIDKDAGESAAREFLALLLRDGVIANADAKLTALTDGVSSEIYLIDDGADSFVVKRALARLKVKDHWTANVDRNRYEQRFIEFVAGFLPQSVPKLLPGADDRGYFAMELLGAEFSSWKKILLRGEARIEDAERAAAILGEIHARSACDAKIAARFDTTENFIQLRIEPYLLTTGSRHPDLQSLFDAEAARLAATRQCLVHGDFSPKNMMVSSDRFVLLDCEVAWYGDPAFDLAFLLTHLLLKALLHAPLETGLAAMSRGFWHRYVNAVSTAVDCRELEPHVALLLPMLLLARIDGKSPVEYLDEPRRQWVRRFTRTEIAAQTTGLNTIFDRWFARLQQFEARA
jgi:aminoglycoside phosphotransferase (APT) family kinase protein